MDDHSIYNSQTTSTHYDCQQPTGGRTWWKRNHGSARSYESWAQIHQGTQHCWIGSLMRSWHPWFSTCLCLFSWVFHVVFTVFIMVWVQCRPAWSIRPAINGELHHAFAPPFGTPRCTSGGDHHCWYSAVVSWSFLTSSYPSTVSLVCMWLTWCD